MLQYLKLPCFIRTVMLESQPSNKNPHAMQPMSSKSFAAQTAIQWPLLIQSFLRPGSLEHMLSLGPDGALISRTGETIRRNEVCLVRLSDELRAARTSQVFFKI